MRQMSRSVVAPGWRTTDTLEPQLSRIEAGCNRKGRGRASNVSEPDILVNGRCGEDREESDERRVRRN